MSYLLSLTAISDFDYVVGTAAGTVPGIVCLSYVGTLVSSSDELRPSKYEDYDLPYGIASMLTILFVAGLMVTAVMVYNEHLRLKKGLLTLWKAVRHTFDFVA